MADRLAPHAPSVLVSSAEPKALETAAIVAGRLGLACEIAADLHEHQRERVGWLAPEQFDQAVAALFERPDELALGEETANRACARFDAAVRSALGRYPDQTVAIVSHGTVITLFIAKYNQIDPIHFWKSLHMPAFALLSLPDFRLFEVAARVEG